MELEWVKQNPGATQPLRISLEVECNTSTEAILENIRINSANRTGWIKLEEPHERVAIICGSGPSLADTLDEIRGLKGEVFALNGAAAFLDRQGLLPDYQVVMDARRETADLIGPAKQHLFASQVHPECFKRVPTARLWQATHGEVMPEFPQYHADYCMVGGAVSVGNAALVLAYVMGYRTIHCFGFDSSHRGEASHAFAQPLNDGDPTTLVRFREKEYVASFTMRLQAQYFLERALALKGEGVTIEVHGYGLLPDMFAAGKVERLKYGAMWDFPEYRHVAPGEQCVEAFCSLTKPASVIDFGCGTGRGGKALALAGYDVTLYDFARNCLDDAVRESLGTNLRFVEGDLLDPVPMKARYGFCTDVMEHIPPECVEIVIANVMAAVSECFFQISLVPDGMGVLIGHPLHLSVHPASWWVETFERMGYPVRWQQGDATAACFFVHSTT